MNHSKEWHEDRKKFIGASEVATLLGCNPYGSEFELWATKKGMIEPFSGNEATQLGQDLEASILDVAERDHGELERDVQFSHSSLPIRATLDGMTQDNVPIECKTAGLLSGYANGWGDEGLVEFDDQVPVQYFVQVQAQLLVTKQEIAHLYALLPRRGVCKFQIMADKIMAEKIEEKIDQWWTTHMIDGVEPPMRGATLQVLSKLPRSSESIELDDRVSRVIEDLDLAKSHQKETKSEIEKLQTIIVGELGSAESGKLSDGTLVSFKATERKAYTREVAASSFRTLRIKKGKA